MSSSRGQSSSNEPPIEIPVLAKLNLPPVISAAPNDPKIVSFRAEKDYICPLSDVVRKICAKNGRKWIRGRLIFHLRKLIRDIIKELGQLNAQHNIERGLLNDTTVNVTNGSLLIKPLPKSSTAAHPLYVTQLKECVKGILGDGVGRPELRNFYRNLDVFISDATSASNPLSFKPRVRRDIMNLWYHPLLQSSCERFYFPAEVLPRLNSFRHLRQWEQYLSRGEYKVRKIIHTEDMFKVIKGPFENDMVGALMFSRGVVMHFYENKNQNQNPTCDPSNMKEQLLEKKMMLEAKLSSFFPKLLITVFDLFVDSNVSLSFLKRRSVALESEEWPEV